MKYLIAISMILLMCGCNKVPDGLIGEWAMYYDCPNTTFTFNPDGTAKGEICGEDMEISWSQMGKYQVKSKSIIAMVDTSRFEFHFTIENGEKILVLKKFDQDFKFHKTDR